MKAWEETWALSYGDLYVQGQKPDGTDWHCIYEPSGMSDGKEAFLARAKLAAAAPEMARLLLVMQFAGEPGGYRCPSCGDYHRHKPDCALAAVLRKAGVLL